MFNRLLSPLFTLFNRAVSKSGPKITEVTIIPNPVSVSGTYLISVTVEE